MSRKENIFILGVFVLTATAGVCLVAEIPTVQKLPGWFWGIRDRGVLPIGLLLVTVFLLPYVARLGFIGNNTPTRRIALGVAILFLVGCGLQYGLAFANGHGLDGMRTRIITTGHAEFARTASLDLGYGQVLTGYEELMKRPGQNFARSKPPGQLLFYMSLASLADKVMPVGAQSVDPLLGVINERHRRLVDFATLVLPALSMLTLIPLTMLASRFLPRTLWLCPALLYVVSPPTQLVTLHLDQALYPLLATTTWALAARAGSVPKAGWIWGAAAGAAAWLGLFVSFSLLPAALLAIVFAWAAMDEARLSAKTRQMLPLAIGFSAAFLVLALVAHFAANYDMILRFGAAMDHHRAWIIAHYPAWEGWPASPWLRLSAAGLNLTEFGYWLGIPLLGLFAWAFVGSIFNSAHRARGPVECLALGTGLVLLLMSLFGGSIAETARLWLFMIPAVVLVAADRLEKITRDKLRPILFAVVSAQFAWMFLLKAKQDFW